MIVHLQYRVYAMVKKPLLLADAHTVLYFVLFPVFCPLSPYHENPQDCTDVQVSVQGTVMLPFYMCTD